jgi:hypothetical protein
MKPEIMKLTKISQTQKDKYQMFSLIYGISGGETKVPERETVRDVEREKGE